MSQKPSKRTLAEDQLAARELLRWQADLRDDEEMRELVPDLAAVIEERYRALAAWRSSGSLLGPQAQQPSPSPGGQAKSSKRGLPHASVVANQVWAQKKKAEKQARAKKA